MKEDISTKCNDEEKGKVIRVTPTEREKKKGKKIEKEEMQSQVDALRLQELQGGELIPLGESKPTIDDTIRLRRFALTEIFDVLGTLFMGFVTIYMIFAIILKYFNIWIQDPLLDAPFELIFLVLWIFVPIVIIFAISYWISVNYKIVKKEVD